MINRLITPLCKFSLYATWCPGVLRRLPFKVLVRVYEARYLLTGRLE